MTTYLEPSHHKSWETDGYLRISGFFSDSEVAALRQWVAEIESWEQDPDRWLHHYESVSDGTRLSRTENFIPYHEAMKSTLTTGRGAGRYLGVERGARRTLQRENQLQIPGRRRLCASSGCPRLRIRQEPHHMLNLDRCGDGRERVSVLFARAAPRRHDCAGRGRLHRSRRCREHGLGPRAHATGRHSVVQLLHSPQERRERLESPQTHNLRRLQQSLRRGLAGQILRGQTSGFFTIRGGRFGKIRSNQQNSPFSRKDGIER